MNEYFILVLLLITHIVGDFYLQTDKWVKAKRFVFYRPKRRYYLHCYFITSQLSHALLHGFLILAALFTAHKLGLIWVSDSELYKVTIWLASTHLVIDVAKAVAERFFKSLKTNALSTLLFDQLAHILSIIVIWLILFSNNLNWVEQISLEHLIIVAAYLLTLKPTSILVKLILQSRDVADNRQIPKAGKLIGYLERLITLTLIFANQYTAIGFIIAAKSVLRFGENKAKDTQLNEYVLLGTLASFTFVLLIGVVAKLLLF
ncbi:DUF3307 domain-containing protein [Idiomarina seosinensis]|uniref:DUF3307 domain-containing protein n=1 Tax=Idiomarina seosinensis TaxID=281739 RepID=A0A432ZBN4_9GAMM|nr:DUF3307 domain-containing protein [Idiomarina seosinensis]RUO75331.1 DUF3307 domain-containing protein [Idiomarina seosinensis]